MPHARVGSNRTWTCVHRYPKPTQRTVGWTCTYRAKPNLGLRTLLPKPAQRTVTCWRRTAEPQASEHSEGSFFGCNINAGLWTPVGGHNHNQPHHWAIAQFAINCNPIKHTCILLVLIIIRDLFPLFSLYWPIILLTMQVIHPIHDQTFYWIDDMVSALIRPQ